MVSIIIPNHFWPEYFETLRDALTILWFWFNLCGCIIVWVDLTDRADVADELEQFIVSRWPAAKFLEFKSDWLALPGTSCQKLHINADECDWLKVTAAIYSACLCPLQFQWRCRFISTWKSLRGEGRSTLLLLKPVSWTLSGLTVADWPPSLAADLPERNSDCTLRRDRDSTAKHFHSGPSPRPLLTTPPSPPLSAFSQNVSVNEPS